MNKHKEEIDKILKDLHITKVGLSKILGLSIQTVKKNFIDTQERHNFNANHVEKLKKYIKDYANKL